MKIKALVWINLVPRKCGLYELDQKSYVICTVPIYIEYTQNTHPHTHAEKSSLLCPLFTPLKILEIMNVDTRIKASIRYVG